MTGYRDQSSFSGIIPVKPGWLVGMESAGRRVHAYAAGTLVPVLHINILS